MMIRIINKPLLLLVCLAGSLAMIVASCNKNNDTSSTQVRLLSFGPSGARVGDTIRFIGNNLNQVTEIDFTGNSAVVAQSAFIKQTPDLILIKVPQQAELGYLTLKSPQGNIVTKTKLNLDIASSVTSITKQARPGDNITITGNYLNWITKVTFNNNKVVDTTGFVSKSMTQLVVKVPADAQTGPLVISYAGTDPKDVQTADTLNVTLPMATGLSPNPVLHQGILKITGTDLDLAKQVLFAGVATPVTSFVSQSATEIDVAVPASATNGKVTLVAASGVKTQSVAALNLVMPVVTTMSPNPIDPGANLTIDGSNLDLVDSIAFQNAPVVKSFVSKSASEIIVTVPNGVTKGQLTLYEHNTDKSVNVLTTDTLQINGAIPPPTISFMIYGDALTSNWSAAGGWDGGGWGGTKNEANTAPTRDGSKSVLINYVGGYGSPFQPGGATVNLAGYTNFKISVYGAPGSGGKKIAIVLNQKSSNAYNITLVEGQWTDYSIPISSLLPAGTTTLSEVWVQEMNGTGGFSIYVDDVGLN